MILNGNLIASKIKEEVAYRIRNGKPTLSVCLVGSDPSSEVYVNRKCKTCDEVGILYNLKKFPSRISSQELSEWISQQKSDGILVQLPLPEHIDKNFILNQINPNKDVDCFHPENQGLLMTGRPRFLPCTPAGILEIFKYYNIKPKGKNVVLVNRSLVVGQPLASILTQDHEWGNATVTICHEYTKDIKNFCLNADIIITAVGKSNYRLTGEMVKEGTVVIDVGIFREGKKIRGDCVFEEVSEKASWITPVPGGVGPITVAMLLRNTVLAMERQR